MEPIAKTHSVVPADELVVDEAKLQAVVAEGDRAAAKPRLRVPHRDVMAWLRAIAVEERNEASP